MAWSIWLVMSAANPPSLHYAIREPRSRKAVWSWIGCTLALGVGMPIAASDQILTALAAAEIELPTLTHCGLELGRGLRHSMIMLGWLATIAISSVPGLLSRNALVHRCYLVGAGLAITTLFVLAGSVHLTVNRTLQALEANASKPATSTRPAPPQQR